MAKMSLDALNRRFEAAKAAEEREVEKKRKERFDSVLKGKYKFIPKGVNFESEIDGINSISLLAPPEGGASMQAVVFYEGKNGKERHETVSLTPDGKRLGWQKILKGKAEPDDVFNEIMRIAEMIRIDFWTEIDENVMTSGETDPSSGDSVPGEGPEKGKGKQEDLERIEFLTGQGGAVFGFYTGKGVGFNGYRGFVFDGFVVLDSPEIGNAAYVIEGTPNISLEDGLTDDEKKAWVKEHVTSNTKNKSRQELRDEGAQQIIHRGDWKTRMQDAIDRRLQPEA